MLTRRTVAATNVTAFDAAPKMQPPATRGKAVGTTIAARRYCEVDLWALRFHGAASASLISQACGFERSCSVQIDHSRRTLHVKLLALYLDVKAIFDENIEYRRCKVLQSLPRFGTWPELEWEEWKDTADTLHMYMQIVGKMRMALTPVQNHWWNVPFYLTARGLWTSPLPLPDGAVLDVEFDFIAHEVVARSSQGEMRRIELCPMSVADFYREFSRVAAELGVDVKIDRMQVEVPNPIRCDLDILHCHYDADAVSRFWRVLSIADILFKRFSTNFYGKISPVHFFWGSFDLAVTRFNGKSAPPRADPIQSEAYSHEVISAGFWPGNGGYGRAAFYAYAAPTPEGLGKTLLSGKGSFNPAIGEFLLDYSDVQRSTDPVRDVLLFLQETYSAAADLGNWDRASLDRHDDIARSILPG